jgi:glyoxylase-like metal-dependent hydrolase (beta-lactamase superfamily II)
MKRFAFSLAILLICAALSTAHIRRADTDVQDVTVKTEKVNGNIYVLFGQGGNIGVSAGKDGILIIDDQFMNVADKIKATLKALGSDSPRFVFNTHWHGDHTGGNPIFGQSAVIIAQENVRKRLMVDMSAAGQTFKALPEIGLPMITYAQSLSLHFNGEEIRAVHMPNGHTDGDTIIFFTGSNVVHLGDDFFAGKFPFVDLDSGGSVAGLIRNIDALVKQIPADARLIPGHGPVSSLADLKNYHQMLVETTAVVRKRMDEKKSLDEIKKAGLPDKYKEWGTGFINTDKWIETIYKDYSVSMKK